ncbi:MAG: hypothetical protein IV100_18055 [Myxococcales bacterium]|nr:hypothetical protein [Myxococcales bacterium]
MIFLLFFSILLFVSADRTFMRTGYYSPFVAGGPFAGPFGFDLVVHEPILVTELGVADLDAPGLVGDHPVTLSRRSTQEIVIGPVVFNASDKRGSTEPNDMIAWRSIEPVRVEPGVYVLLTEWSRSNNYLTNVSVGNIVVPGDLNGLVTPLASIVVDDSYTSFLQCGPNMRFKAADPPPLTSTDLQVGIFADCEDVACRMPGRSGMFNIRGRQLFCDNESQGGGWTLLWSANESSCEANGWTSTRGSAVLGDPQGCRTDAYPCKATTTPPASTPFRAVLLRDFELWTLGNTGSVITSSSSFDGVAVHADTTLVWAFLASSNSPASLSTKASQCPCAPDTSAAASAKLGGVHWSCDTGQRNVSAWQPIFGAGASICSGTSETVRVLPEACKTLSVSICQDFAAPFECVKLSKGAIFVRKTPNFNRATSCPASATLPPVSSTPMAERSTAALGSTTTTTTNTTANPTANTTTAAAAAAGCEQIAVPSAASDVAWIVPIAIAAALLLVVVVLVAMLIKARRALAARSAERPVELRTGNAAEDDGRYGNVSDVRASEAIVYDSSFGNIH